MVEEKKDKMTAETEALKVEEAKDIEAKAEEEGAEEKIEQEKEAAPQKSISTADLNFLPEVRKDLPVIKTGDVLRISYRVIEGGKERIQVFEGTVIAIKNTGITRTITVRKTSFGIAVERIFPLNSKLVHSIEVKKHSRVRRAKLYYLRNLKGKAARLKELR